MTDNGNYETILRQENEELIVKLAEARQILEQKKKMLNEKKKKYGDNNVLKNWEIVTNDLTK